MRLSTFVNYVSYADNSGNDKELLLIDPARLKAMFHWFHRNREYALSVCQHGRKYSENPLDTRLKDDIMS